MLFHQPFERAAARWPEKIALVCDGERVTYRALAERSHQLAHGLRAAGVEDGDRVAVCLPNSVAAIVAVLATLQAGAAFVVIHSGVKTPKRNHILADSGARILVAEAEVAAASSGVGSLATILQVGDEGGSFAAAVADQPTTPPPLAEDEDRLCYLLYTSGSTGQAKGVMMSHKNAGTAADAITGYLGLTAEDTLLSFSPLASDYGLYNILMPLRVGATAVLERGYLFPRQILETVPREKVTGLALVPTILAMLLQSDGFEDHDLDTLRFLTSTGQSLPPAHIARVRRWLPDCRIYSMYGLTECKRVAFLDPAEIDRRPDSVGKAMAGTDCWLVDENGERLPTPTTPGARVSGELVIRGDHVMQGYWNLPAETAACLRPGPGPEDRVLHSGDLFELDDEGFLYFKARKDDLIKSSGERISPREIEDCIFALEDVLAVVVHPVPDPILGHAIHATVAIRPGSDLDEAGIRAHCAASLERVMVPKRIEICAAIPQTLTGKLRRTRN